MVIIDQGWERVQNRKTKARSEENKGSHGNKDQSKNTKNSRVKLNLFERMSMSFYITNFPKQVTTKDMWHRCSKWGTVVDVFIPNRLSKAGRRFGFVRYIKVDNAARLLSDLKSMWFGNFLVYADTVKYSKNYEKRVEHKMDNKSAQTTWRKKSETSNEGKSYADILFGNKGEKEQCGINGTNSSSSLKRRCINIDKYVSTFSDMSNLNPKSVLAKLIDPVNISIMSKWLLDEGFVDFNVCYIGGRWLLITFDSLDAKDSFTVNEFMKGKVCSFKTPQYSFVPDERMVWVEISGLPLGAWDRQILQEIIGDWGKCMFYVDEWEKAFSKCKVCILSRSQKQVYDEMSVKMGDKYYDIWLKEFAMWEPSVMAKSYASSQSENLSDSSDFNEESVSSDDHVGSEQFDANLCRDYSDIEQENDDRAHGGLTSCEVNHAANKQVINDEGEEGEFHFNRKEKGNAKFNLEANDQVEQISHQDPLMSSNVQPKNVEASVDIVNDSVSEFCNAEVKDGVSNIIFDDKQVNLADGDQKNVSESVVEGVGYNSDNRRDLSHNDNGLDDYDNFLLTRLLHQDKCQIRPVKAVAIENFLDSSESSLKKDQSIKKSSVVSPPTPPVTDLNIAEESCSTWLDYVGPLITDELDSENCWGYKDPSGNDQGPFSLAQLHKWKDYFPSDFKIWRYSGSVKESILLHDTLKRRIKNVG